MSRRDAELEHLPGQGPIYDMSGWRRVRRQPEAGHGLMGRVAVIAPDNAGREKRIGSMRSTKKQSPPRRCGAG
jgi:hypothetical protein